MNEVNWKMLIVPLVILFVFIGGIIGIVNWQKSQQGNSAITVNIPEGAVQTSESSTIISGKVAPGSKVTINGKDAKVGDDGTYSETVSLNQGDNKIEIKAEKDGKTQTIERSIKEVGATTASSAPPTTAPATQPAPQAGGQPSQAPATGSAPSSTPATTVPSSLSTSGPADMILPVAGFAGIVMVGGYYLKSRKKLEKSMRK